MIKILITLLIATSSFSSDSIGYYSNGKIKDAEYIFNTNHFEKLFTGRGRNFTSISMNKLLNDISRLVKTDEPTSETLQIGDLTAEFGGKISRHASHQNGLDSDVVYLRKNRKGQDINNPEWAEYFTANGKLTSNYDSERNWKLFAYLLKKYDVNRIFVDTAMKKHYCKTKNNSKENKEILRYLRPAKYHKTHFHLRLTCPDGNDRCTNQGKVPQGSGCNNIATTLIQSC